MFVVPIYDIIRSDRAKTTEHALAVIQYTRSCGNQNGTVTLDFSNISWITSMFADRLVRALSSLYGRGFEKKISVIGVEPTNVMFDTLWQSALDKFKYATNAYA